MRPHGKTKLGFFPLPVPEATRLKNSLVFASNSPHSIRALEMAWRSCGCFMAQPLIAMALRSMPIGQNRREHWESRLCKPTPWTCDARRKAMSLLYLNPPYDWESGQSNNQRLEWDDWFASELQTHRKRNNT
jgi:hypothetical protein